MPPAKQTPDELLAAAVAAAQRASDALHEYWEAVRKAVAATRKNRQGSVYYHPMVVYASDVEDEFHLRAYVTLTKLTPADL